jgi:hypothetical protein
LIFYVFSIKYFLKRKGVIEKVYPILIFKGMDFPCKPEKIPSSQHSSSNMISSGGKYKI